MLVTPRVGRDIQGGKCEVTMAEDLADLPIRKVDGVLAERLTSQHSNARYLVGMPCAQRSRHRS
ncbi:MAG: hypothetical protein JKY37_27970 [Nannocystaceae bacterium]|nr:hypothetical protein [Nannocystaceae bacterium]